jgi:hypothetical protein
MNPGFKMGSILIFDAFWFDINADTRGGFDLKMGWK